MIKNKLYPYIEKYINEFLWGFSKEQLNVGVINGTIVLEKLNIRMDQVNKKLDVNDTPLWMKSGTIEKIQVCCSLMNFISEKPLEITIDNIDIILCPSAKWILRNANSFIKENDFHLREAYDPIDNNFHDIFLKRVNIYDGSILKSKAKLIEFFKDKSKIAEVLNKLLNVGLKYYYQKSYLINLKIKNVHLRFEDDLHYHLLLKPGLKIENKEMKDFIFKKNKIAMGLTIQDLELSLSADGNVKKNNFKVDNLNVYYETNPEIYIPIKTFFDHLDKDLVINEKYYEFLKNNLIDFNKTINNFHVAANSINSNNQNNNNLQPRLQKNHYFQCNKIVDNLNFMGNFCINSTDKGNIDFFSKTREKNYKFFIQIATSEIKIELNDFIINYVKNLVETMRAVYLIDTIQEFKPWRKPYNLKDPAIQKILKEEKNSGSFNKKRKLIARDWLHYMVWFSRFKKAIYGKLDNNLLQDEFSRYYNICCNSSVEVGGVLSHLENMKHEISNDANNKNNNNNNDFLSAEMVEDNLKKELNPEEINLNFSSDFLIKSIKLRILNAFENDQIIDLNNINKQIKNENGIVLTINSIDKKAYLNKEDFSVFFSLKNFIVETQTNKISILKNLEEKIASKSKEMKAISGSTAVVLKKSEIKFNEIPRHEMISSNSKSSLNSGNNQVPNLKISMRPSNSNTNNNGNNNNNNLNLNGNLDELGNPFNINKNNNYYNNNVNQVNYPNSNSAMNSITYENNDDFKHRKKLLAIDEVLENINGMNSSHINSKYIDDDSFMEINSKNNIVNSIFFKDKNKLETKRAGNIVDILLEKEGNGNSNHLNYKEKNNDKLSVISNANVYSDARKGARNEPYANQNDYRNMNNIPSYQNNYSDSKANIINNNSTSRPSNAIKLVFNSSSEKHSNSSNYTPNNNNNNNNHIFTNIMNIADNLNRESLFSPESQFNQIPSNNNKLNLKFKTNNPKSNNNFSNENTNIIQENISYIQSDNAINIKTHNFQELFKSTENNNISNTISNETSKLNLFEIIKINSEEKNKNNLCLDFSYHKKNHTEKLDKNKKLIEEISVINDKINLSTGDLILNLSNGSAREAKETLEKLINVKNLNMQRIRNSNLIKNLGLEKDLFELRLRMLEKLETEVNLPGKAEDPKHKKDNSKLDNFKLTYSNMNRNEINNYIGHLKNEIHKIDQSVINDPKCDYRIYKVFEFLKKKSFELEVNIPVISVFSYVDSNNNFKSAVSSYTNKSQSIYHLITRSKIPKIYLYMYIQNDSLLLKFLEYEYEFYNKNNSLKFEFSEFLEVIKTKYDLIKHPIEAQFDSIIKEDSFEANIKEKSNSAKNGTYLSINCDFKNKEILSKTISSTNIPNKFGALKENEINFDTNNKNLSNADSNFKHNTINNLNKKFLNEPNINNNNNKNNNSNNFLEESISNHLNTTKKLTKPYSKIDENVRNENLNYSSDINSNGSVGLANINNNINSINKIISKNISNNFVNINSSVTKNPQSSLFLNKEDKKNNNYFNNNYETINESLNNTIKISAKENLYSNDMNIKKTNFNLEKNSSTGKTNFENIFGKAQNNPIPSKKNDSTFDNNNEDLLNSIEDLDENIILNEASKDIYVYKKNKNNINIESTRVFSLETNNRKDIISLGYQNENNKNDFKSSDQNINNKSNSNNNQNNFYSKNNPYKNLNKQLDSTISINNTNIIKNSSSNATDKILEIMKNKTSSNKSTNYDKNSNANAFTDKIIGYDSNKNTINFEVKDNINRKSALGSTAPNKKKEEINEILKQYKINVKQTSQNKIATIKPRTKSIK